MTNEEVKALLRELARDTGEVGDIRSRTIRIRLGEEAEQPETAPPDTEPAFASEQPAPGKEEEAFEAASDPVLVTEAQEDDGTVQGTVDGAGEAQRAKAPKKRKERKAFPKRRRDDAGSRGGEESAAGKKRTVPTVEPPDFESDAWMFRSPEEDPQEAYHRRRLQSTAAARTLLRRGDGAGTEAGAESPEADRADGAAKPDTVPLKEKINAFLTKSGIGLRELSMIGGGIVIVIVLVAVILTLLGSRKKRENVTADPGLTVTVEKEPAKWCRSGEVTLGIRAASPIQSVSVGGSPVAFSGQNAGKVTFAADSHEVDLMVVSEDQVRSARVGFSRIDSEDPQIAVRFEDGLAVLEASDDRSGVKEVWYGTVDVLSDVPSYKAYSEPFSPEKGRMYSYFAIDKAGNVSTPVSTNLTPASAMALNREEVSLFAGETYALQLTTTPASAFLNGLTWSSSDEAVAVVSDAGVVTAVADGETVIRAEAEGLKTVSCVVRVRSEVSVTISAVGDMTLGDDISFSPLNSFTTVYSMYGADYFLANVRDIFAADDITFANFEGTLTEQGTRANKEFAFRGDPSYVKILTDGSVEAVTLANNHSYDYGEISHTDTQRCLDEAGVEWCEGDKIIMKDVNGVRTALIGIYVLQDGAAKAEQVESTIAEAKAQGAQIIVVAFHWGTEKETRPDATQKTLAHLAIDSGADLVVGHHPHVLQGIEKYAGKYICYSLGNFCFGGNSDPADKDTMIFQQTFHIVRGGDVQTGGVSVIPCSVSSASEWNNYQPTPATGEEAERIMEKINDLCEPFGTSF